MTTRWRRLHPDWCRVSGLRGWERRRRWVCRSKIRSSPPTPMAAHTFCEGGGGCAAHIRRGSGPGHWPWTAVRNSRDHGGREPGTGLRQRPGQSGPAHRWSASRRCRVLGLRGRAVELRRDDAQCGCLGARAGAHLRDRQGRPGRHRHAQPARVGRLICGHRVDRSGVGIAQRVVDRDRARLRHRGLGTGPADRRSRAHRTGPRAGPLPRYPDDHGPR